MARQDSLEAYYTQEVYYEVEDASEVFLVWGVNGWAMVDSSQRLPGTFVNRKNLYTPFEQVDGTLVARVRVPRGGTLDCIFWVQKSADGSLRDEWDVNGYEGGTYSFATLDEGPIHLKANLGIAPVQPRRTVLNYGWKILLGLLLLSPLLIFSFFKWAPKHSSLPYFAKIILAGLSLYGFHFLIRINILHLGFRKLSLFMLTAGGADLLYIGFWVLLFLGMGIVFKGITARQRLLIAFYAIALLSLLVALLNIGVVENLGGPFTYQWLYYSDFLTGKEAQSAFSANFNFSIFLNLLSALIAMPIVAYLLGLGVQILPRRRSYQGVAYGSILVLVLLTYALPQPARLQQVKAGRLMHPVSAFVQSTITAQKKSALLDTKVEDAFVFSLPEMQPTVPDSPPIENILLIVLESTGSRYLDLYGGQYAITPVLNEQFAHAALFENIYAHAPATNKTLSSLLLSVYPWVSHQTLTEEKPELVFPSLPSELQKRGYRTSFFTSTDFDYQRAKTFLQHRGWERISQYEEIPCMQQFQMFENHAGDGYGIGIDDACMIPAFTDWIDADSSRPFFSMLWTNQGHYPYFFAGTEHDFGVNDFYFNRYLNAVQHDDQVIGMAIDSLKARGLFESTLIAIMGDHGESFGHHNQFGHGNHIYEENIQIPLILINPQLFHGERSPTFGSTVDLAPTLLSLAGIQPPKEWVGRSLFQDNRPDEMFFFAPWTSYLYGCRIGDQKVIFDESQLTVEWYDLSKDPEELHNLWREDQAFDPKYRQKLAGWMQFQDRFIQELLAD